jgi:MoaA/NifB/PqqE/SkfB family radical SAM enzyme
MENKQNLLDKEKTQKENRIWVRIASACNNKCIFCLDSDAHNWTFPDVEKIKNEIKNWYKEGHENRVIISGWEASINPKFPEYIKYAKEIWYKRVQTVTNWNMFFSEQFCKKVFEAGLEEVTFSFHWHNSVMHDYLVATPWSFMKSLKWLIYIKKYFPEIIINIDIVVNKINVKYLPDIVKFFIKLWVYEYDILQIIPFWRGFAEYRKQLFYNISDYSTELKNTWELWKMRWMHMWTNRFPAEAFEWYEDLIQDPRKIKSEVMWESIEMFEPFIKSRWEKKPECFWEACEVCFLNQYCHWFLKNIEKQKLVFKEKKIFILNWEEFPSQVYDKYWETKTNFIDFLNNKKLENNKLINVPKCLWWEWIFQKYNDLEPTYEIEDYTKKYINNLYLKKSLRCNSCKHNNNCDWIWINFIRSYWFDILKPII